MNVKNVQKDANKKLLIAFLISVIILYSLTARYMYMTYKYNNPDFTLTADFFINHFETISKNILYTLTFFLSGLAYVPLLIILPIIYFLCLFWVYFSERPTIIKLKLPLFIFFLVSFFWFAFIVGDALATF